MKNFLFVLAFTLVSTVSIGQQVLRAPTTSEAKKKANLTLQAKDWLYILTVTPQVTALKTETDTVRARLLSKTTLSSTKTVTVEAMEQEKLVALYQLLANEPYAKVKDYMPRLTAAFAAVSPYVAGRIKYMDEINSSTINYKIEANKQTLRPPRKL